MIVVVGNYHDLLRRLFSPAPDGHISFGSASSVERVADFACLGEWTAFRDYIMEGFVRYSLRARPASSALALEVKLNGSNRDEYVAPTIQRYIRQAGLEANPREEAIDA